MSQKNTNDEERNSENNWNSKMKFDPVPAGSLKICILCNSFSGIASNSNDDAFVSIDDKPKAYICDRCLNKMRMMKSMIKEIIK